LVKTQTASRSEVVGVVAVVKGLPRHHVREFRFSRTGFFRKLDQLMAELDDVGEFIHLEAAGRSYILKVRHR
jgi:hypothetical protein